MNESKSNRVLKLEKHRTVADQKELCSCDCHRKTLGDYEVITEERASAIVKIIEGFLNVIRWIFKHHFKWSIGYGWSFTSSPPITAVV